MHGLKPECMRTRLVKNLLTLVGLLMVAFGGAILATGPQLYSNDWVLMASIGAALTFLGFIIPKSYVEID